MSIVEMKHSLTLPPELRIIAAHRQPRMGTQVVLSVLTAFADCENLDVFVDLLNGLFSRLGAAGIDNLALERTPEYLGLHSSFCLTLLSFGILLLLSSIDKLQKDVISY